jgi:hypothetical protein
MTQRTAGTVPAVLFFLVLGGIILVLPLEFGTLGYLLAAATAMALAVGRAGRLTRLQRTGAYLVGGGVTGIVVLGFAILRTRNLCGTPGGQVRTATGTSYACYPIETLWFVLGYGVLAVVGTLLLYLDWRQGMAPDTESANLS